MDQIAVETLGNRTLGPTPRLAFEYSSLYREGGRGHITRLATVSVRMLAWMRPFDALICPVYCKASLPSAFEYDPEMLKGFSYTSAFNFTGWPGVVVRGGTSSDGMPIGVQVVAAPLARGRLSRCGEAPGNCVRWLAEAQPLMASSRHKCLTEPASWSTNRVGATAVAVVAHLERKYDILRSSKQNVWP